MLALGNVVGVPQVLYEVRKHDRQISHTKLEAQIQKTRRVALTNCQNVLRLPEQDAARAHAILNASPRERTWRDWFWFLTRCVPALRWKSVELYLWLLLQTARKCLAR